MVKILAQSNNMCNVLSLMNSKVNNSPRKVPSRQFAVKSFLTHPREDNTNGLNNVKFQKNILDPEGFFTENLQHNINFSARLSTALFRVDFVIRPLTAL